MSTPKLTPEQEELAQRSYEVLKREYELKLAEETDKLEKALLDEKSTAEDIAEFKDNWKEEQGGILVYGEQEILLDAVKSVNTEQTGMSVMGQVHYAPCTGSGPSLHKGCVNAPYWGPVKDHHVASRNSAFAAYGGKTEYYGPSVDWPRFVPEVRPKVCVAMNSGRIVGIEVPRKALEYCILRLQIYATENERKGWVLRNA